MRSSSLLCLAGLALCSFPSLGQSLSLVRKEDTAYSVETKAPAATPYVLQASENLGLWVDVHDEVRGPASFPFDGGGVKRRFYRLAASAPPEPEIRIMLIGDSTASDVCGWGQAAYPYFKSNARFLNYAVPWTSTSVFLRSEQMEKMLLVKPDYVLIEFGYVDANSQDPTQSTSLTGFAENLRTIIGMIRDFGGEPILVTMHAARGWDQLGNLRLAWEDRSEVIRQVAAEQRLWLIDLHQLTREFYTERGEAGSKFTESECWPNESMHFSMKGGEVISKLVFRELPPKLGPYLTGILDPLPTE